MLAPSPAAHSENVSDFLPCGLELTCHRWAVGLGQLIYLTAKTCELPDIHCLHLRPDLLHPLLNQTLLRSSAWTSDPSLSSRSFLLRLSWV